MMLAHFAMENAIETTELARHLAEEVRRRYGAEADIDGLLLVCSVTEEDGAQRIAVEADGMALNVQQGHLRHALNSLSRG